MANANASFTHHHIEKFKSKYVQEIQAMMYTFGEIRYAMFETTQIVEEIVHSQLIELLMAAVRVAQIRSSRTITPEDLLFCIRHDISLTDRLREFLLWKSIRKSTAKGDDDKISSEVEDEDLPDIIDKKGGSVMNKKTSLRLPWDHLAALVSNLTNGQNNSFDSQIADDSDYQSHQQGRLEAADRLTSTMTREEYLDYTECRQASFTYKKSKKFRDWLNVVQFSDLRPNDDAIEIFGFFAYETVRKLTEKALEIKKNKKNEGLENNISIRLALFTTPRMQKPLERQDIYNAYFSMQQTDKHYLFCRKLSYF